MKCSKCNRELIGNKKINDKAKWGYIDSTLCIIFGGPILTTIGTIDIGHKLWRRFKKNEIDIKCPHCKAKLTLTRAEYKELKKEIEEILDEERKSKQNRVIK